jgi:hypothetical protein
MRLLSICLLALPLIATSAQSQSEDGIAWEVRGVWMVNRTQVVHRSDGIAPGSLLTSGDSTNASMLVLLPDGQRLLFECHDAYTCAQGFRVPALISKPEDDAIELFETVRAAMRQPESSTTLLPSPTTTETEAIVALQADGSILLRQALGGLPPGQYKMAVLDDSGQPLSERPLNWAGAHDNAQLPLSHAGIYRLRLFGSLGGERMRVLLLAESSELYSSRQKEFAAAQKVLKEWNESFPGWPVHEWLQLYLRGLAQEPRRK